MIVHYQVIDSRVDPIDVRLFPVEFIDWECLTIGNLGWGQLQIKDANYILVNDGYSRKKWMIRFCNEVLDLYVREINKICNKRMKEFEGELQQWNQR